MSFSETKLEDSRSTSAANLVTDDVVNKSSQMTSQDSGHEDQGSSSSTAVSSSDDRVTPPDKSSQITRSATEGATVYKVSTHHTDHSVIDLTDDFNRSDMVLSKRKDENDRHKGICALKSSSSYDVFCQSEPYTSEQRAWSDSDADILSKDSRIIKLSKSRSFPAKSSDSKEPQFSSLSTDKIEKVQFSGNCVTQSIKSLNPKLSETGMAARDIIQKDYGAEVFNYEEKESRDSKNDLDGTGCTLEPITFKVTSEVAGEADSERKLADLDIKIHTDNFGFTHLALVQNMESCEEEEKNAHSVHIDSSLSEIGAEAQKAMEKDFGCLTLVDGLVSDNTSVCTSCEEIADPSFLSTSQKTIDSRPVPRLLRSVEKALFPCNASQMLASSGTNIDQTNNKETSSEIQTAKCTFIDPSEVMGTSETDTDKNINVNTDHSLNISLEIETQQINTVPRAGKEESHNVINKRMEVQDLIIGQCVIDKLFTPREQTISQTSIETDTQSMGSPQKVNCQIDAPLSSAENTGADYKSACRIMKNEIKTLDEKASTSGLLTTVEQKRVRFDNTIMVGSFESGSLTNYMEKIKDVSVSNDNIISTNIEFKIESDLESEHASEEVKSASREDLPTTNKASLEESASINCSVSYWLESYLIADKDSPRLPNSSLGTHFLKSEDISDDTLEGSSSGSDQCLSSPVDRDFPTLLDVTDTLLKVLSIDKQLPRQVVLQRCSSSTINLTRQDSLVTISSVLHELLGIQSNHELKLSNGNVVGVVELQDKGEDGEENSKDKVSVLYVTNLFEKLMKSRESIPGGNDIYESVKLAFSMFQHYLTFEKTMPSLSNSDCFRMSTGEDQRNVEDFSSCERIISSEVKSAEALNENDQISNSMHKINKFDPNDTKSITFIKVHSKPQGQYPKGISKGYSSNSESECSNECDRYADIDTEKENTNTDKQSSLNCAVQAEEKMFDRENEKERMTDSDITELPAVKHSICAIEGSIQEENFDSKHHGSVLNKPCEHPLATNTGCMESDLDKNLEANLHPEHAKSVIDKSELTVIDPMVKNTEGMASDSTGKNLTVAINEPVLDKPESIPKGRMAKKVEFMASGSIHKEVGSKLEDDNDSSLDGSVLDKQNSLPKDVMRTKVERMTSDLIQENLDSEHKALVLNKPESLLQDPKAINTEFMTSGSIDKNDGSQHEGSVEYKSDSQHEDLLPRCDIIEGIKPQLGGSVQDSSLPEDPMTTKTECIDFDEVVDKVDSLSEDTMRTQLECMGSCSVKENLDSQLAESTLHNPVSLPKDQMAKIIKCVVSNSVEDNIDSHIGGKDPVLKKDDNMVSNSMVENLDSVFQGSEGSKSTDIKELKSEDYVEYMPDSEFRGSVLYKPGSLHTNPMAKNIDQIQPNVESEAECMTSDSINKKLDSHHQGSLLDKPDLMPKDPMAMASDSTAEKNNSELSYVNQPDYSLPGDTMTKKTDCSSSDSTDENNVPERPLEYKLESLLDPVEKKAECIVPVFKNKTIESQLEEESVLDKPQLPIDQLAKKQECYSTHSMEVNHDSQIEGTVKDNTISPLNDHLTKKGECMVSDTEEGSSNSEHEGSIKETAESLARDPFAKTGDRTSSHLVQNSLDSEIKVSVGHNIDSLVQISMESEIGSVSRELSEDIQDSDIGDLLPEKIDPENENFKEGRLWVKAEQSQHADKKHGCLMNNMTKHDVHSNIEDSKKGQAASVTKLSTPDKTNSSLGIVKEEIKNSYCEEPREEFQTSIQYDKDSVSENAHKEKAFDLPTQDETVDMSNPEPGCSTYKENVIESKGPISKDFTSEEKVDSPLYGPSRSLCLDKHIEILHENARSVQDYDLHNAVSEKSFPFKQEHELKNELCGSDIKSSIKKDSSQSLPCKSSLKISPHVVSNSLENCNTRYSSVTKEIESSKASDLSTKDSLPGYEYPSQMLKEKQLQKLDVKKFLNKHPSVSEANSPQLILNMPSNTGMNPAEHQLTDLNNSISKDSSPPASLTDFNSPYIESQRKEIDNEERSKEVDDESIFSGSFETDSLAYTSSTCTLHSDVKTDSVQNLASLNGSILKLKDMEHRLAEKTMTVEQGSSKQPETTDQAFRSEEVLYTSFDNKERSSSGTEENNITDERFSSEIVSDNNYSVSQTQPLDLVHRETRSGLVSNVSHLSFVGHLGTSEVLQRRYSISSGSLVDIQDSSTSIADRREMFSQVRSDQTDYTVPQHIRLPQEHHTYSHSEPLIKSALLSTMSSDAQLSLRSNDFMNGDGESSSDDEEDNIDGWFDVAGNRGDTDIPQMDLFQEDGVNAFIGQADLEDSSTSDESRHSIDIVTDAQIAIAGLSSDSSEWTTEETEEIFPITSHHSDQYPYSTNSSHRREPSHLPQSEPVLNQESFPETSEVIRNVPEAGTTVDTPVQYTDEVRSHSSEASYQDIFTDSLSDVNIDADNHQISEFEAHASSSTDYLQFYGEENSHLDADTPFNPSEQFRPVTPGRNCVTDVAQEAVSQESIDYILGPLGEERVESSAFQETESITNLHLYKRDSMTRQLTIDRDLAKLSRICGNLYTGSSESSSSDLTADQERASSFRLTSNPIYQTSSSSLLESSSSESNNIKESRLSRVEKTDISRTDILPSTSEPPLAVFEIPSTSIKSGFRENEVRSIAADIVRDVLRRSILEIKKAFEHNSVDTLPDDQTLVQDGTVETCLSTSSTRQSLNSAVQKSSKIRNADMWLQHVFEPPIPNIFQEPHILKSVFKSDCLKSLPMHQQEMVSPSLYFESPCKDHYDFLNVNQNEEDNCRLKSVFPTHINASLLSDQPFDQQLASNEGQLYASNRILDFGKKVKNKSAKLIGKPALPYHDIKSDLGSEELKRLHSLGMESLSTSCFLSSDAEPCRTTDRPTNPNKDLHSGHPASVCHVNTNLRMGKTPKTDRIGVVNLKPGTIGEKAGTISSGKSSPEINSTENTAQHGRAQSDGDKSKVFDNGHTSGGEGAKGFNNVGYNSQGTGSIIMGTFSADFGSGAYVCEKAPSFHEYGLNLSGLNPTSLKVQYMDATLGENFPCKDVTSFPNNISKQIKIVINSAFTTSSKSPSNILLHESMKESDPNLNLPDKNCAEGDPQICCDMPDSNLAFRTLNAECVARTENPDISKTVETGQNKTPPKMADRTCVNNFVEHQECLLNEDSSQIHHSTVNFDLKVDHSLKKRTIPMLSSNYRIASQDVRTYLIEKELMESQCRRLQVEVSTLQSENKHIKDKNTSSRVRISELQSEVFSLTKQLEETKSRIGQEITAVTRKSKETMETKFDSLQRDIIKQTKENDKLHSELAFAKSQLVKPGANVGVTGAGEQTVSALTMENAALKEELKEVKELLSRSEAQVISLEEQKRSAEVNLNKLTKFKDYLQHYQDSGQSSADKIIKSLEKRLQVTEERFHKERSDRGNTLSQLEEKLLAENSKLKVVEQELTRHLQRAQDRCKHLDLKVKDKREENMNLRLALPLGTDIPTSTRKNSYDLPHSIHSIIRAESQLMMTDIKEIMTHVQRETGFSPGQEVDMVCELWRRYDIAGRKLLEWEQELFQLKISQGDITTGLQNLREMKTQYEEKIQQAEEEVEDILNEKNTLETTYKQQLSELVSERHEALAKLKTLEDLMAALKAENESLRKEICAGDEKFNETIDSYKADLEEMASAKDSLEVHNSQLERENQRQKSEIATLRSELKVKERSLDDLTRELEMLDKKLNQDDNTAQREIDLLQQEVLDLQSEVEAGKNKYKNLCEENINMEEKVVVANQQAALSKVKAIEADDISKSSFEQELNEREVEATKLSNQYQEVEKELQHAKQGLLLEAKQRTQVEKHLTDLQTQLEEKQESLERRSESEREQSKQYDSLKGALDSVVQELRKSQATVKRLHLELNREKDKTSQLQSSMEQSSHLYAKGQITPENITASYAYNSETTPETQPSPRIQTSPDISDLKHIDLQRERDRLNEELSESLEAIEAQRGEISELHNRVGVVNQQLRSERDTLCQLTADKSDLKQHLQSCIEERDEIYKEKEVSDHDLIKLEENLHDVITKFDLDARGRHENFQSNYPNVGPEAKKVVGECFSLRLLLEGKDKEIGMVKDKLERQNQEMEFSQHKLDMLMEENLRNREDITRQTADITNKVHEQSSSNEVNKLLVDERSRLQMELHQAQTQLDREKDYIERRNAEVADILKKYDESSYSQKTTQNELHKLDNKTAVLETDLRHANGMIAHLQTENQQSKAKIERLNEDIRSLTSANSTLEKNLEIEKHMVSDSKSTINKLQDDFKVKSQQLEYLKHEKAMLLNNLDSERKTVDNLQTQLQSKQGEISKLTEEVKQLTLQLDALKGKLLISQESYETVCKEKQNIYTDYQEMCRQLNEKEKLLTENQVVFNTSLENIQKDLSVEKANLETDRSATALEKDSLRDDIRNLKEKLSQKEVQLCTFGRTLQELEEMTKQNQELEDQLMKMTSAAEDTKILINSHRTEIMTLRDTHKTLEEKYSNLEAKYKSQDEEFRSKRDNHSEQTFEFKQTIAEMKTSNEMEKFELKEKLNRTESQLETSQSNLKTLQDLHKEILVNSQNQERTVQEMKNQIHQLTTEKQILSDKLGAFEARFENTQMLSEESISRLKETQIRHSKTEQELDEELNKTKKLKKDLSELEAAAFVHESSVKAKQEQIDMLQSEVNKLRQVLETQRQQLASKYKKTAFDLKQQMNDHELEKNRLTSQCEQITANLEQAREQITVKSRENLKLQEDLFNMEAQVREASSKLRQTQETLRQEEEQQSKLNDRNLQQEEELRKLRSFVSKKAETDGTGEGKMSWSDVNRFMQDLNSKMDSLKSEKFTDNDNRDLKNFQRLRKHLAELETELHTEKALHQITRSSLQGSEDDCQRLRRQLRSKQRTSFSDDRSEKSRMEKINEIIAKSQTQAQLLLATGGYYDYSSSRDVSMISPRSVNHSPDNSLLDHHLHFNLSHNNNNMASTPPDSSPVTSTSSAKN